MEATLTQSRVGRLDDKATGFRQSARALDDERFRTRTITKEELSSPSSSPEKQTSASSSSSSRSSKQRRADEASRFLTQTIGPGDLVRREEEEESLTAAALESEALRVVASLSELKGRSRSQSAEILGESEMHDSREELCRTREASRELDSSRDSSKGGRIGSFDRSKSPAADDEEGGSVEKARPRVCKPWESRVQEQEVAPPPGIRGRRRALYSPPMKRATVPPPVAPKPNLAGRGRPASSPQTSPRLVRGTRATQLRQANSRKDTTSVTKAPAPRTISPRGSAGSPRGVSGQTPPRSQPTASSRSPKLS